MASVNRTAYNLLVDDSGLNIDGTIWTKNQIKTVILDPIDDLFELEITPAQLTGNTNDYNPAGIGRAAVVVLALSAAWNLTGIAYVSGDCRRKLLINTSAFNLTIKNDVTSSAGNRFACPNAADLIIRPNGSKYIHHRDAVGYWYVEGE